MGLAGCRGVFFRGVAVCISLFAVRLLRHRLLAGSLTVGGAWAVGAHGVVPAVVLSLWVLPVMQHVAVPPEAAGWGAVVVVAVAWLPCCGVQVPGGVVVPAGP